MPRILEDSPTSLSPYLKPVQPSARLLDSASSAPSFPIFMCSDAVQRGTARGADDDLTDQENAMPSNKPKQNIQSDSAAGLDDLAFGKLSLSDAPQKPQCDTGGLEDSDSEQNFQVNTQAQSCLVDSDVSEDEAVQPPCRTPLQKLGAVDDDASGSDDEEIEDPKDSSADQESGAEPLHLQSEEGMEFYLRAELHDALYCHQVAALKWLWGRWVDGKGGILGDDMGLGKTRTMCSFLSGLVPETGSASIRRPPAGCKRFRRALLVVPTTLMDTWIAELESVGVAVNTVRYHGAKKQRERMRTRLFSGIKVAVTTYETIMNDTDALSSCGNSAFFPEDRNDAVPAWDVVILDEGHKVKNASSKTYQALYALPARMRVVVTGTPMQNNLMEMHALLDLACPGLLPDRKQFKANTANVIEAGQDKNAPSYVKHKGKQCAEELHALFDPYLLRRCKATTQLVTVAAARAAAACESKQQGASVDDATQSCASAPNPEVPALPGKTDLVVWLQMHPVQRKAYQGFLQSSEVSSVLNQTSSALAAISVLKKICDHPALLNDRKLLKAVKLPPKFRGKQTTQKKPHKTIVIDSNQSDDDNEFAQPGKSSTQRPRRAVSDSEDSEEGECDKDSLSDFVVDGSECESSNDEEESAGEEEVEEECQVPSGSGAGSSHAETQASSSTWNTLDSQNLMKRLKDMHIEDSCKTVFTLKLLEKLAATGHRTLVFAQSLGMLDMLQRALRRKGVRLLRMDGQSAAVKDRQKIVERFQRKKSIPVFLLSAQVGGLGLTITAADRVIILDPSWNPAVDCQSVDRAFRIGQKRHVVVYRLITCGTVEEKIYRRQVFKGGLAKATIEKSNPIKYFSEVELRELFTLHVEALNHSHTAEELHKHHAADRSYDDEITAHVASLTGLEYAVDTSDHSVLFSRVDDTDLGPMVQQERPSQAQLVSNESTSATSSRKAVQASALGSMVPTDVKAPSAEALLHKKLVKRAGALEETITQLTAALSQTNGGALLKDKGAKLHSGLQTAEEELAATQKSLNELAASEVATSGGSSANRQADVLADMLERTELK